MRLDLKEIIHVPGAKESFSCELDLSSLDFYGAHPICEPVTVVGEVRNRAGMLELEATLSSNLHLHCDSCGKPYERVMSVPVRRLLATELENEEDDEIILLSGSELDVDEVMSSSSQWIPNICAVKTVKAAVPFAVRISMKVHASVSLRRIPVSQCWRSC